MVYGYKCFECGNNGRFNAIQDCTRHVSEYGHYDVTIDAEGGVEDYHDWDCSYSEVDDEDSGDLSDIECHECGSSNVHWVEDEEDEEDEEALREQLEGKKKTKEEKQNWKEVL